MRALLRAWDPIARRAVWDREIEHFWLQGGVLTTGGNLVFQGLADGTFNAYAADERFDDIVLGGTLVHAGMPKYDELLDEDDAGAVHAYLIAAANEVWAKERAGKE